MVCKNHICRSHLEAGKNLKMNWTAHGEKKSLKLAQFCQSLIQTTAFGSAELQGQLYRVQDIAMVIQPEKEQ